MKFTSNDKLLKILFQSTWSFQQNHS